MFNSIQHYGLAITRATFTSGAPTWPYVKPFGAHLFLSADAESVQRALHMAWLLRICYRLCFRQRKRGGHRRRSPIFTGKRRSMSSQIRIAFDGDAVLFDDEGERVTTRRRS